MSILLNSDQREAVETTREHCLVVACPGSGKTRLLVSKIEHIYSMDRNARIVAVTFTRDAARELKQRVFSAVSNKQAPCLIGTFHSIAMRMIQKYQKGKLARIVTSEEQESYLRRAWSIATQEQIEFEVAAQLLEKAKCKIGYQPGDDVQGAIYAAYTHLLQRNNVIDFNDMMHLCIRSLVSGDMPHLNAEYLMVDEFQDTDEVQMEFILHHQRKGLILTAVGDDDQSIYGFRNALGYEGLTHFQEATGAKLVTLGTNYRCNAEILAASERLILENQNRILKRLYAYRGDGGSVILDRLPDRVEEAMTVADFIKKSSLPNPNYGDDEDPSSAFEVIVKEGEWAILARTNRLLETMEAALMAKSVPHYRSAGKSMWERRPGVFYMGLLRSAVEGDKDGIDLVFHWAGMSEQALAQLHEQLGADFDRLFSEGTAVNTENFDVPSRTILQTFQEVAPSWRKTATDSNVKKHRIALLGIVEWMKDRTKKTFEQNTLDAAARILGSMKGTLADRLRSLSLQYSGKKKTRDGVALITMHGSKGLEFNNVAIITVEEGVVPSPKAPVEEERRLMFVAMTRAKNRLLMTSSGQNLPSPFLAAIFPS